MSSQQQSSVLHDGWIRHQRSKHRPAGRQFACCYCPNRRVFQSSDELFQHALQDHNDRIPNDTEDELRNFRTQYEAESAKRPIQNRQEARKSFDEATTLQLEPPPAKRPHPTHSVSGVGLQALNLKEDKDVAQEENHDEQPRKRAAVGDGISAGSSSPFAERDHDSVDDLRSKGLAKSGHFQRNSDPEMRTHYDMERFRGPKRQLWRADNDTLSPKPSYDAANVASIQANRSRTLKFGKPPGQTSPISYKHVSPVQPTPTILGHESSASLDGKSEGFVYNIMKQPETRPISQEQLVAEVKGIYAGLVMIERKCIEVDNKQAAQTDGARLNNEQWQALITLHRTLLHEHHDFFLASQHPSASPALRRLASKCTYPSTHVVSFANPRITDAMPARMWRHGIHSFLELLRHSLPVSRDHMLAFIYLAYSMMALLFETVPAFEDTWIECLGDLGRYRELSSSSAELEDFDKKWTTSLVCMAIEDDDQRDREVWTGVARHWYWKASDKAPTTGRLYHHLAILARPNAFQQLFYYAKSLCIAVPFVSARESILSLFDPVLMSVGGQGQFRLPYFETAFIKAHGVLFTNNNMEMFEPAVTEFIGLLDAQIGRVTRKFMEQGHYISTTNCVATLGFAAMANPIMRAISSEEEKNDAAKTLSANDLAIGMTSLRHAQRLHNATLTVVLRRLGDPNILPFVHCALVFMMKIARYSDAMDLLEADYPWELLSILLNTLVGSCSDSKFEEVFPIPQKDEARPLPEDYILRGILFGDQYYPDPWFATKVDEEEKYQERPSMTAQRKERILFVACRIAASGRGLEWDSVKRKFSKAESQIDPVSRTATIGSAASATTMGKSRSATWRTQNTVESDNDDAPVKWNPEVTTQLSRHPEPL
ncbi:hypothetical protein BJ878DRAFT_546415 [Calycina marina]|uniref:Nonsense-mediated mRNA decay factor n=1 Tax=Calycina marina TaxID=1763456 RepID=A0A9P8CB79_9HELO|nr:hypothetical protein BJ878DRAFT_546415 [Calycina marina]